MGSNGTSRHGKWIAALLAAIAALLLIPSLAGATTRPVVTSITGSATAFTFHFPYGIAVDETSGNIFVNDGGTISSVAILGPEGGIPAGVASPYKITGFAFAFEPSQAAVDNVASSPSKGVLYVTDVLRSKVKKYVLNPTTQKYEAAGELLPTGEDTKLNEPTGVTVDAEGNVYAVDYSTKEVVKFGPTGTQLARYTEIGLPANLAVDSAKDLFVAGYHNPADTNNLLGGSVSKFPADGTGGLLEPVPVPVEKGRNPQADGVAVDFARNQLFVGLTDRVLQLNATTLAKEGEFGMGVLERAMGIAVNSKTNRVYVTDAGKTPRVLVFGAELPTPIATANPASGIGGGAATLNGTVNPTGTAVSSCQFEYLSHADFRANELADPLGADVESGRFDGPKAPTVKPCEGALPADSADHPVTAALTGLTTGTTYHFRIKAANANGPYTSPEKTFVASESASGVTLTVAKSGSGTGKVTSSPTGIDCGSDCSEEYAVGTKVTLEANADAGSEFKGFSGACTGTGSCEVTMSEAKSVTAEFAIVAKPQFLLKILKAGSGTGIVSSSPVGIDCGSDCEETYEEGTAVTLTGVPGADTEAVVWSGCSSVDGENKCLVSMTGAKEVTATFEEEPKEPGIPLTVSLEGTGSGTVISDKGLISCSPFCSDEYEAGTKVTLTATPSPGSVFYSWKYCDAGGVNGRQCTVTLDKAKTVKATFITSHDLEVSKAPGSGPGKVQSSPGGVLCLFNCSETTAAFREGTEVVLKPTPAKHFHFVQWSGDCSGSGACAVTMGEDHEVQAEFAEDAKHNLALSKSGGGAGIVKSSVAGINCGVTCSFTSAAYYQGEVVELTATPGKGSAFKGWSGAGCSGTGTCTVTVDEAKSVTAEFN